MKVLSKEQAKLELESIMNYGDNDISLDVEDINLIVENKDLLVMSVCENNGKTAAYEVIQSIVSDFEENGLSLLDMDGILVHFSISSNYEVIKLMEGMDIIYNKFDTVFALNHPSVIFGVSCDDKLSDKYVKGTVFIGYTVKEIFKYTNNFIEVSSL